MTESFADTYVDVYPHFAVVRDFDEIRALIMQMRLGMLRPGCGDEADGEASPRATAAAAVTYMPDPLEENCYQRLRLFRGRFGSERPPSLCPMPSPVHGVSRAPSVCAVANTSLWQLHGGGVGGPNGAASASTRGSSSEPKMLIVWDVDDTLVGSGVAGMRQHRVFESEKMRALFARLRGCARHLLLTQGSVDDLFDKSSGGLLCDFREFFWSGDAKDGGRVRRARSRSPATRKVDHDDGGGFASAFKCFSARATRTKDGQSLRQRELEQASSGDEVGVFDADTKLVRLEVMRFSTGTWQDVRAMHGRLCSPPSPTFSADGHLGRWLVLRPGVWGITLLPLEAVTEPTPHTAFVDGRAFHKMDVVWSLAASGHWDSVLFIDNNFHEVGAVRSGTRLCDVLRNRSVLTMKKLYSTEYMLLAVSAKLREMGRRYGRDVTVPPGQDSNGCAAKDGAPPSRSHGVGSVATTVSASTSGLTVDECASASASPRAQSRSCDAKPASSAEDEEHAPYGTATEAQSSSAVAPGNGVAGTNHGTHVCCVGTERPVDLVVAHFHMSSARYAAVLHGSRPTPVAPISAAALTRYVGQPVLPGGVSCTDEEYTALIDFLETQLVMIYQYIEEDIRVNGYFSFYSRSNWRPSSALVHMPVITPPCAVPHIRRYYDTVCDAIEKQLVAPLLAHRKLSEDNTHAIRSVAYTLYQQLMYNVLVIDPLLTAGVAAALLRIYVCPKSIPSALGKALRAQVRQLRGLQAG